MAAPMTIDPSSLSMDAAIRLHRREIVDLLRKQVPVQAALSLEKEGWPRDWACEAIRKLEVEQNPGNLTLGSIANQAAREKLSLHVTLGAGLFFVCLVLGTGLLISGRIFIPCIVGIFVGAGLWMKAAPALKRYPDRRLPAYIPPKSLRGHHPDQY